MKTAKDLKGQEANLKSLPNFVKVQMGEVRQARCLGRWGV